MSDGISLMPGDLLRIERRYLVDGVVSTALAEGLFAGVENLGTAEHIVLRDEDGKVRLIPLAAVSEITLVNAVQREAAPAPAPASWDPGVA